MMATKIDLTEIPDHSYRPSQTGARLLDRVDRVDRIGDGNLA